MPTVCEQCASDFTGPAMKCMGFCASQFCCKCSGMTDETHRLMNNNGHMVWMCFACRNILAKTRFSNAVTSVNAANQNIIEALKTEIKDSILNDIRTEIRTSFKTLVDAVPSTPLAAVPSPFPLSTRTKRPREIDVDDDNSTRRPPKLLCGTNTRHSDDNPVAVCPTNAVPDFWLYLSNIQPNVADEQVRTMVNECLGTDNLKLVKLIPRDRDQRTLTFISFKVGISSDLKDKAMSVDTWPLGIRFREFEDHSLPRVGFWRPTTPVPEIMTPHATATSDQHQMNVA